MAQLYFAPGTRVSTFSEHAFYCTFSFLTLSSLSCPSCSLIGYLCNPHAHALSIPLEATPQSSKLMLIPQLTYICPIPYYLSSTTPSCIEWVFSPCALNFQVSSSQLALHLAKLQGASCPKAQPSLLPPAAGLSVLI